MLSSTHASMLTRRGRNCRLEILSSHDVAREGGVTCERVVSTVRVIKINDDEKISIPSCVINLHHSSSSTCKRQQGKNSGNKPGINFLLIHSVVMFPED